MRTWLDESVYDKEILSSGYDIHRREREGRRGGRILLATKNHMTSFRRHDLESDCELIWVEITTSIKLLFGVFYRPPNTDIQYLRSLRISLDRINNTKAEKFLVGDFNLSNLNWTNQLPCSFVQIYIETFEMLNDAFLTQVNTELTRNDNILDLILTNFPGLIPELSAVIENFVDSDHRSVLLKIKTSNNYESAGKTKITVFNYKKANWDELKRTLSYIPCHVAMLDEDINQNLIKCEDLL